MHQHHQRLPAAAASPGARALGGVSVLGRDLLALLWPTSCVGCGASDRDLCPDCVSVVLGRRGRQPLLPVEGIGAPCFAAARYDGPIRGVLLAYKHGGAHGFVRPLGHRLALLLAAALTRVHAAEAPDGSPFGLPVPHNPRSVPEGEYGEVPEGAYVARACIQLGSETRPIVVPLPSRPRQVRLRGWRHIHELVRRAIRVGRLPLDYCDALRTLRGRTGQVGLGPVERERNARRIAVRSGAARRLAGRSVVLVDDIVTTGATMRSAVEAIDAVGARVVLAVCLCVSPRKDLPQKTEWNLTGERG